MAEENRGRVDSLVGKPNHHYKVRAVVEFDVMAPDKRAARVFVRNTIDDEVLTLHDADITVEEVK